MTDSSKSTDDILNELTSDGEEEEELDWKYKVDHRKEWKDLDAPATEEFMEVIETELKDQRKWGSFRPFGTKMPCNRVGNFPDFQMLRVNKLQFPDGRVWDANLRRFTDAETS